MPQIPLRLLPRLPSEAEIARLSDWTLRVAGAVGQLPTPLDNLIAAARVQEVADPETWRDRYLASIPERAKAVFHLAWQKIRGIADLRERAVYVSQTATASRIQFAKGHELGHQMLPWHNVNLLYRDDDLSLSSEAQELFDAEANLFAAEVIFQGRRFRSQALDYQPSFDAVFLLADKHGASKHATLRRYVEEHDEPIAMFPYWPSEYTLDMEGRPVLRLGKGVGSVSFVEKYAGAEPPGELRSGDPWTTAREASAICNGHITLKCGPDQFDFQWHAWWNSYCLLVMLRRRPVLHVIGRSLRT